MEALAQAHAAGPTNTIQKPRELETALHRNQAILDRLAGFDERLGLINGRLSGDMLKESAVQGEDSQPAGIIGQFQDTHDAITRRCDSIDEWLTNIEHVI